MAVLLVWIIVYFLLILWYNSRTILYLPLLIILVPISTQLISFYLAYDRYVTLIDYSIILFVTIVSIVEINRNYRYINKNIYYKVLFFIFLLLLLDFINSSDFWLSFKRSLGILSSLILFIAVYTKPIYKSDFNIALKTIILTVFIFSVNFVLLSTLKIGPPLTEFRYMEGYSAEFLRTGNITFFQLHGVMILMALFMLLKRFTKKRVLTLILWFSFLSIVFLAYFTYKRTYILTILSGVIIYYLLFIATAKHKVLYAFTIFFTLSTIYISTEKYVKEYITKRSKSNTKDAIINAPRVLEFVYYPNAVLEQKNPLLFLFIGSEPFNSRGKFRAINFLSSDGERFLHNDFAHLLYGTGFIGLLLYVSILIFILKKSLLYIRKGNLITKQYATGAFILIIAIIISGLGDGILNYQNRMIPFWGIGLFLSASKINFYSNG